MVGQEGGPLPGPRVGPCLTMGSELSEETHMLTKREILRGRSPPGKRAGGKGNLGRTSLPYDLQSQVLW